MSQAGKQHELGSANKRYLVHFGGAMIAYALVLFASVFVLNTYQPSGLAAALIALTPVLPALYALHAYVVRFRAMDEFQRRVISEATLWSAGIVGIGSFSWGFVEGAVDIPALSAIWIFPALIMMQGAAQLVLSRRYQ